jgi:hypothetical protein
MTGTLTSNSAEIPFNDRYFGDLRATPWTDRSPENLRQAFRDQGYLFLKRYLDPREVLDQRSKYLAGFPSSLFKPGTRREDGIFSGTFPTDLPPHGASNHPAHTFVRTREFERFVGSERLQFLSEILLEHSVTRLRRTPLRHFVRGRGVASRAHIDFSYLDCGTSELITIWIPIGDCPLRAGGLIYLEDSQKIEFASVRTALSSDRAHDHRPLTHELQELADLTGRRWLWADFEAGDIVVHSPFMAHASVNSEIDLMRVSTDVRYARSDAPVDPRWRSDWSATDGF